MKKLLFLTKAQQIFLYSVVLHLHTVLLVRLSSRLLARVLTR